MIYNETKYNTTWKTKKLNELGTFARGKSKHRPRDDEKLFIGGGYPLVQTGEIKGSNLFVRNHSVEYNEVGLKQSKLWDKGTLCITIAANIAETAILSYPMCFPDSIVGFNANQEECSELFMHYIFTYIKQAIQSSVSGSIQDNINIDYLEKLDFKIPDKETQDKIVNVLYNIDKKIEANQKICENTDEILKLIYDYWFVQYDFPNKEGKAYKKSGGKFLTNEILGRKIPQNWKVKNILDMVEWISGSQPPKSQFIYEPKDGYIRFIQNRDYSNNNHVTYIPESKSNKICDYYDIMIDKYGDAGKVRYGLSGAYNVALAKLNVKDLKYREYIRSYFNDPSIYNYLHNACNASTRASLNENILSNLTIVIPDDNTLNKYTEIAQNILKLNLNKKRENEELQNLRDFLLPLLMNGQLTSKNKIIL